jgi:hypothetical protein
VFPARLRELRTPPSSRLAAGPALMSFECCDPPLDEAASRKRIPDLRPRALVFCARAIERAGEGMDASRTRTIPSALTPSSLDGPSSRLPCSVRPEGICARARVGMNFARWRC